MYQFRNFTLRIKSKIRSSGEMFTFSTLLLSLLTIILIVVSFALPLKYKRGLAQTVLLPAFPGAEGFGARSIGGRGGRVIEVTNLNDDGPGSFRAALLTSGPRIIVFRVSGTIAFDPTRKWPVVTEPYLTIAGQTAPGDGVTIKGEIEINTHDVIIRYLRVRPGYEVYNPSSGDGIYMSMASNVILDHCSISWATDGVLDIGGGSNITVQWTSASEALDCAPDGHEETCHSTGPSLGNDLTNVTFHHNLIAHNSHRNPKAILDHDQGVFQYINNVVYDTNIGGQYSGYLNKAFYIDAINNYYKRGLPVISPDLPLGREPHNFAENDVDNRRGTVFLYALNTLSPYRTSLAIPEEVNLATYETDVRLPRIPKINPPAVNYTSSLDAYNAVLNGVGATLPVRDAADIRLIASVRNNTGGIIDTPEQVGGWPVLQGGTLAPDSDHDGMPDSWESNYGLSASNANDGSLDADGDGYTNVEEYLNSTHPLNREATPTYPGLIPGLPITTYQLPQGNNLTPNGSFETDPFVDYTVTKAVTSDSITWATDQFHSSSRSVKAITSGNMDQASSLRLKPQKITTNNSKGYYVTVWLKFSNNKPYGKLRLEFYNANGVWQKSAVSNIGFGTDWMQIYVEEDPKSDSAYVVPSISIYGPGTMWVDDLVVVTGDNTGLCGQGICSSGKTCSTCSEDCGYCPLTSASPTPQPTITSSPGPSITPVPTTGNVLRNPTFDLGTANWTFYTNGVGSFSTQTGDGTGPYGLISVSTPGTNVQLYQNGFTLESGRTYRLSFSAKSNTGHDLQTMIHKHTSPYTSYDLSVYTVNLTSSWQTFTRDFTASGFVGTTTDTRLRFWLAPYDATGDQYYIDNVSLSELTTGSSPTPTPPPTIAPTSTPTPRPTSTPIPVPTATPTPSGSEIIVNGSLESGTSPWIFYTNGTGSFVTTTSNVYSGTRSAQVNITTVGTNIQFYQRNLTLSSGIRYRLRFAAKSNTGHDIYVSLFKDSSPYTNYGVSNRPINLTNAWLPFTVDFTATGFTGTVSDARLIFYLPLHAQAGDVYYFDSVSLTRI